MFFHTVQREKFYIKDVAAYRFGKKNELIQLSLINRALRLTPLRLLTKPSDYDLEKEKPKRK